MSKRVKKVAILCLAMLWLFAGHQEMLGQLVPVSEEGQDTAKSDRVHIDHADIRGEVVGGREYLHLSNDVEMSQDSIFFYCDTALVIDKQEVTAVGNVIIQKGDSLEVFSDTLLYFADTRQADLTGEVALIHGTQQLWTTHLQYDMVANIASYDVPAQLIDGSTQLSSKRGKYFVDTEEALFIDSVVVIDTNFTLLSDSLRYTAPTRTAHFIAPTRILQDGAEIYCEDGYYDMNNRRAEFSKNAQYKNGDQIATAELIIYEADRNEVMLIGDAWFREGAQEARGDTIVYWEETGDTRISGHASYRDDTRQLTSDDVIMYNRVTEKLGVRGRGEISENNQILTADDIDFDQKTGIGRVEGNVVIRDTVANTILESDRADFVRENGFVKAYGQRRPVLKSLVDADTLYVTADTLFSFEVQDTSSADTIRHLKGYMDVRIFRGTMQGLCDSITFNGRDSVFRMFGDPILWSDTTQFTADTIDMYLVNETLDHLVLRSKGLIISSILETFYDQISGKRIVAQMDSSKIESMHVTGNAQSVYYVLDDEGAFVGVNQVVSSEIFFNFLQGKLNTIKFLARPTGSMTPMREVDHNSMRLEGFNWRSAERPEYLADLF